MKRVLVIEDNDDIRREIVDSLQFEGFTTSDAENGRIGLEVAARQAPDLVLCDLMMPEMDGYETLKELRARPATATVPFLFLTARAERQDRRRGMALGADDYLTKPFTIDELVGAVNAALSKRARIEQESEEKLAGLRTHLAESLPHELRTPIACIIGYAELLPDSAHSGSPEVGRLAQGILDAGVRLNRITENALLYMQLELFRTRRDHPPESSALPVPLHAIAEHAGRNKAHVHGRELDLVLEIADATTSACERYVVRLAEELIDNAFKFSRRGTPVRVRTAATDRGVLFEVADEGAGMSPEQVAAIGAFVQFDRMEREQQGLGLGLTIAHRIAAVFGGELSIVSQPGHGTTVSVTLPRAADASAGSERASGGGAADS